MKIGIDPDIRGGIAAVRHNGQIALFAMPTRPMLTANQIVDKKGRKEVDSYALIDLLMSLRDMSIQARENEILINIEYVHSSPQMGVASAFKFGQTFGQIYGAALATGLPIQKVIPRKWKQTFGLIGTLKDASRVLAIEQYPALAEELKRKKDVGKADALWIALY